MDPALQLLRDSEHRVLVAAEAPARLIDRLQESIEASRAERVRLIGHFGGNSFTVAEAPRWSGYRYPGALSGSVDAAGAGSRVSYKIGLSALARLVLRVWAAISVLVLVFSIVMVLSAIVLGQWGSIPFGAIPAGLVAVVWWTWRRAGERAVLLEEWLVRQARATTGGRGDGAAEQGDEADER